MEEAAKSISIDAFKNGPDNDKQIAEGIKSNRRERDRGGEGNDAVKKSWGGLYFHSLGARISLSLLYIFKCLNVMLKRGKFCWHFRKRRFKWLEGERETEKLKWNKKKKNSQNEWRQEHKDDEAKGRVEGFIFLLVAFRRFFKLSGCIKEYYWKSITCSRH